MENDLSPQRPSVQTSLPHNAPAETNSLNRRVARSATVVAILLITAALYGTIYFREESVPTGIGANLVPAERVLRGEVPYRDFYKIQTPGILILNAGLFRIFGTSLLTAQRGVLVFKVLTILIVFIVARQILPLHIALIPVALSLLWLPPGGPFRAAPIQYEMPFIVLSVLGALRWLDSRKALELFLAGLAVGVVALFKQNVGVYCFVALLTAVLLNAKRDAQAPDEPEGERSSSNQSISRISLVATAGFSIPIVCLVFYLIANEALGAALRVFVRGPGEHLQMKLTGYPLPKYAAVILAAAAAAWVCGWAAMRRWPRLSITVTAVVVFLAAASSIIAPMGAVDNVTYWFAPALLVGGSVVYLRRRTAEIKGAEHAVMVLSVLLLFAGASFGEGVSRSVRGMVIGTMPPQFLLMTFLLTWPMRAADKDESAGGSIQRQTRRLVLISTFVVLLIFGGRIILPHYFAFGARRWPVFRADTELNFDGGGGIYLPRDRGEEVDAAVNLIRARVGEGEYFFAHSVDATSYYFLSARNSPTGATLWNDAGTNDAERASTMQRLQRNNVRL